MSPRSSLWSPFETEWPFAAFSEESATPSSASLLRFPCPFDIPFESPFCSRPAILRGLPFQSRRRKRHISTEIPGPKLTATTLSRPPISLPRSITPPILAELLLPLSLYLSQLAAVCDLSVFGPASDITSVIASMMSDPPVCMNQSKSLAGIDGNKESRTARDWLGDPVRRLEAVRSSRSNVRGTAAPTSSGTRGVSTAWEASWAQFILDVIKQGTHPPATLSDIEPQMFGGLWHGLCDAFQYFE